ncbi:MAG: abortive phage infection protein [Clostridiales bacterium]|nr:MAG: abortive phage infection protein [Clostridiales bacterium]
MTQAEKIDSLLESKKGIIQTGEAVAAGISRPYFLEYVEKRQLQKVGHGIYMTADAWADPMYLLQARYRKAVFSHETALFLHGLTDREPLKYSVTVKSGYNTEQLKKAGVKAYSIKKELYEIGLTDMETPFGFTVASYDMERTVCDILRNRNTIEIQVFQDALKQYAASKEKNLHRLSQYAKLFRVEKTLKPYLEVLL